MNQVLVASIYMLLMLGTFILDIILTKHYAKVVFIISERIIRKRTAFYLIVNTKILLLLDIYFFCSFFFEKKVNALTQNKIIKIFAVLIYIIIGLLEKWYFEIYIYFAFKFVSFLYLYVAFYNREDVNYRRYNIIVGTDATAVNMELLKESLVAFKIVFIVFSYIYFLGLLVYDRSFWILFYQALKVLVYWLDLTLIFNNASEMQYYIITLLMYLGLASSGIIGLIKFAQKGLIIDKFLYLINEILLYIVATTTVAYLIVLYINKNAGL